MTERNLRRKVRRHAPAFIYSGGGAAGWLWLMEDFSPETWPMIACYVEVGEDGEPSGVVFASLPEAVHAQIEALRTGP